MVGVIPLRVLRWCPQIAHDTEQHQGKNVPESSNDPCTLPSLAEGVCCFEVNL